METKKHFNWLLLFAIIVVCMILVAGYLIFALASMAGYRLSFGQGGGVALVPGESHDRERIVFDGITADFNLNGGNKESHESLEINFEQTTSMQFEFRLGDYPTLN